MKKLYAILFIIIFFLSGCGSYPNEAAIDMLSLPREALAARQLQTRVFETSDYEAMLNASIAILQDHGFTIDEAEYKLGVLVGSKQEDATSAGQVAGAIFIAILGGGAMPIDRDQTIRVSLMMRELSTVNSEEGKAAESSSSSVRVTFQRVIRNTANQITRMEQISAPHIYQEFFNRLSQAVFLEAHEL